MATRPTTPETLGPDLILHLDDVIPRAEESEGKPELGEWAEDISAHYRAVGICILANDADAEGCFSWLISSGLTRRHFLETVGASGAAEPQHMRISYVDPLLDAMAARQWKLAADIGRLSAPDWMEGVEYEDDFCYGEFLRRISGSPERDLQPLLARWRKSLEGGRDPRLNVAAAFAAKDSREYEAALRSLLQSNERKAEEMADPEGGSPQSSDYPFFPNRWISIEGLALLAAGERAGLSVDYELERCPRIARVAPAERFRPRVYPNLPLG